MIEQFDMPLLKSAYELYKTFYSFRGHVPKSDRYAVWQRAENLILEIFESIFLAGQQNKIHRVPTLEKVSAKLNLLRMFIRLMKDVKTIDLKKYILLQQNIDEIGRMLGGWLKSSKEL